MAKVLAMVHLKSATKKQYDNLVQDLTDAGQLKLKVRPHHFAFIKEGKISVVDIWESEEDFGKFGEIMVPLAKKNGIDAEAEIFPLYNELD